MTIPRERQLAGSIALALTEIQRRDLRKLLKNDDLVERIAGEVALYKTSRIPLSRDTPRRLTDAQQMKRYRDLHKALAEVHERLRALPWYMRGGIGGLDRHVRHRNTGGRFIADWGLDNAEAAVRILEGAVQDILDNNAGNKGGRPSGAWSDFLYFMLSEIVRESGAPYPRTFPEVLRIALEAGGADAGEADRLLARHAKRVTRRRLRTNLPKT